MDFEPYVFKSSGTDNNWVERELSVLRIGDRWLFEISYYKGCFKSWGIDLTLTPRVPLSEVAAVRAYWGRHIIGFSLLPKHYLWDDDIIWSDTDV